MAVKKTFKCFVLFIKIVSGNEVKAHCDKNETICEFHLKLEEHFTMTKIHDREGISNVDFIPFKMEHGGKAIPVETCGKLNASEKVLELGELCS